MIQISLAKEDFFADPATGSIIILRDKASGSAFPVWIGMDGAQAILMELERIVPPRPMTHDLAKNLLSNHGIILKSATLTKLEENIYYAQLITEQGGQETVTDCRPSDAMALALRFGIPIHATEEFWAEMISMESNQQTIEQIEQMRKEQ